MSSKLLRIYIFNRPLRTRTLFSRTDNQGDQWHWGQVEVNVDSRYSAGSLSIRFRGSIGVGSASDIALDDICVANGECGKSYSALIKMISVQYDEIEKHNFFLADQVKARKRNLKETMEEILATDQISTISKRHCNFSQFVVLHPWRLIATNNCGDLFAPLCIALN